MNILNPAKILICLGIVGFLNATWSSLAVVERNQDLSNYINTHWITSLIFFAGVAQLALVPGDYYGEVFSFFLNMGAVAVSGTAIVIDYLNFEVLGSVVDEIKNIYGTKSPTLKASLSLHITYGLLDIGICVLAFPAAIMVLYKLLKSNSNLPRQPKCVRLLGLGAAFVVVTVIRAFIYFVEFCEMSRRPDLASFYLSYTMDEPVWIAISLFTAVCAVVGANGSLLLRGVALVSTAAMLWPSMFYLWVDYRFIEGSTMRYPVFPITIYASLITTIIEIILQLVLALCIASQFISPNSSSTKITLGIGVKRVFRVFSVFFVLVAIALLFIDLMSIFYDMPHRTFYGSERKTPFMALFLAVFGCLITFQGSLPFALPISLTIIILTANSTFFQLVTYSYLCYNSYFTEEFCDSEKMSYTEADCKSATDEFSLTVQFFETVIVFLIFSSTLVLAGMVVRIMRMVKSKIQLNDREKKQAARIHHIILGIGVMMEFCALLVILSLFFRRSPEDQLLDDIHPMVYIYSFIYHVCLVMGMIVLPLYQILAAEDLKSHPLAMTALLCLSACRFTDLWTQLDYRGTGERLNEQWRLHTFADFTSLFGTCSTILLLLRLRLIGRHDLASVDHIPLQFDNPLSLTDEHTDYIQLRSEEVTSIDT